MEIVFHLWHVLNDHSEAINNQSEGGRLDGDTPMHATSHVLAKNIVLYAGSLQLNRLSLLSAAAMCGNSRESRPTPLGIIVNDVDTAIERDAVRQQLHVGEGWKSASTFADFAH